MSKQKTGWHSKSITRKAHVARNREVARLKAERVPGTDHTPAEHLAIQRDLKAQFLAREAQRRAA